MSKLKWVYTDDPNHPGVKILVTKKDPKALDKALKLADALFIDNLCKIKPGSLECEECDDWVITWVKTIEVGEIPIEKCRRKSLTVGNEEGGNEK